MYRSLRKHGIVLDLRPTQGWAVGGDQDDLSCEGGNTTLRGADVRAPKSKAYDMWGEFQRESSRIEERVAKELYI